MAQKVAEMQQFVRRKVIELVSIDGGVEWEVLEGFVSAMTFIREFFFSVSLLRQRDIL